MSAQPDTVLWRFACPVDSHGEFDVWALDWSEVDPADRPRWLVKAGQEIEAEDASRVRCPTCRQPGYPVGPKL